MKNLELKARYTNLSRAEKIAGKIGATFQWKAEQTDTFFRVPSGRLKLREVEGKTAELIGYQRPDKKQAKWSDYEIARIETPDKLKSILGRALGIVATVRKERQLFLFKNARIHLDKVWGLGHFIEFEVVVSNAEEEENALKLLEFLKREFRLTEGSLVDRAYVDLLQPKSGSGEHKAKATP